MERHIKPHGMIQARRFKLVVADLVEISAAVTERPEVGADAGPVPKLIHRMDLVIGIEIELFYAYRLSRRGDGNLGMKFEDVRHPWAMHTRVGAIARRDLK